MYREEMVDRVGHLVMDLIERANKKDMINFVGSMSVGILAFALSYRFIFK